LKETELKEINAKENIKVREEIFSVPVHYYKCSSCNEEFMNLNDPVDPLDTAYRLYRKKHGWLQPEEIKNFRKSYNLTQKELADILSLGDVTLSRYENGALQDAAHEKILRTAMNPQVFLNWIEQKPEAIPDREKRNVIIQQIRERIDTSMNTLYWLDWEKTDIIQYSNKNAIPLAA